MLEFLKQFDLQVFKFINQDLTNPVFDVFFPFITDLHKTILFNLIVYPLFLFLFYRKYKKYGVVLFLFMLLTLAINDFTSSALIKDTVQRMRPADLLGSEVIVRSSFAGYSFPSNHAANMFAFANFAGFYFPVAKWLLMLVAALIAFSRVYNGVHFPLDVLGGAMYGLLISLAMLKAIGRFNNTIDKKIEDK